MVFDYRTPDTAYQGLLDTFSMTGMEFHDELYNPSNPAGDFKYFCTTHKDRIHELDTSDLKFKINHLTSSSNECSDIKHYGLRNLQWVLSNRTELSSFLNDHGIQIDCTRKILIYKQSEYSIEYKTGESLSIWSGDKKSILNSIGHKVYYDHPVWGFFWEDRSYGGKVDKRPELLMNISQLSPGLSSIEKDWISTHNSYKVTAIVKYNQITSGAYGKTIFDNCGINTQSYSSKIYLISLLFDRMNNELPSEAIALLNPEEYIAPENITQIETA